MLTKEDEFLFLNLLLQMDEFTEFSFLKNSFVGKINIETESKFNQLFIYYIEKNIIGIGTGTFIIKIHKDKIKSELRKNKIEQIIKTN